MTGTHHIPHDVFDALAFGFGGTPAAHLLQAGQYSKQLVKIRAILELAPRPARAALTEAVEVIADVGARRPAAAWRVLTHPQVGA